jgi:hypothetical protein
MADRVDETKQVYRVLLCIKYVQVQLIWINATTGDL